MKVVIIEDEKLSAEHLCLLLQRIDSGIEVVQYLDTVKSTIKAFQEGLDADLLFLDIHLADGNSFEIFNKIQIDLMLPMQIDKIVYNDGLLAYTRDSNAFVVDCEWIGGCFIF